ncbi:MAG: hypothetical protein JKY65_06590 [Planctomycetes bacterium]|nr:hypothetical protein [Planctomycetota bacterium]
MNTRPPRYLQYRTINLEFEEDVLTPAMGVIRTPEEAAWLSSALPSGLCPSPERPLLLLSSGSWLQAVTITRVEVTGSHAIVAYRVGSAFTNPDEGREEESVHLVQLLEPLPERIDFVQEEPEYFRATARLWGKVVVFDQVCWLRGAELRVRRGSFSALLSGATPLPGLPGAQLSLDLGDACSPRLYTRDPNLVRVLQTLGWQGRVQGKIRKRAGARSGSVEVLSLWDEIGEVYSRRRRALRNASSSHRGLLQRA